MSWPSSLSIFYHALLGQGQHAKFPHMSELCSSRYHSYNAIIAGFFTGGSLAIRGGYKAARNGAIGCAVLLAVIEGVGIGFQRMLAGSTKLELPPPPEGNTAVA